MKRARQLAIFVLFAIFCVSLLAEVFAPAHYATQFRDAPNAAPSHRFPLGTDDLGRDRLSRLLYGTRISLLLAPASALLATLVAGLIGGIAGFFGGWRERILMAATDMFLSLPWFFLLLLVRAALPLNVSPLTSIAITFALLGVLGWAASARVVCAGTKAIRNSDFVLLARACGQKDWRVLLHHVLPTVRSVLAAQFWISVPVFILTEANLGMLGLGVSEPMPSWGSLLRELESYPAMFEKAWLLAPLVLLIVMVSCFQLLVPGEEWLS